MKLHIRKRGQKGAALVEYIVLMALIGVVLIFVVLQLGANVTRVFDSASSEVAGRIDTASSDTVPGGNGGGNPPFTPPASFYFPPLDDPNDFTMPVLLELEQNIGYEGAYGWRDLFLVSLYNDPAVFNLDPLPDPGPVCNMLVDATEQGLCYLEWNNWLIARIQYAGLFYDAWSVAATWTNPDPMSTGIGVFGNYAQGTVDQLLSTGADTNVDNSNALFSPCGNDPIAMAETARVELWGTDSNGNRLEGRYVFVPTPTPC